MLKIKFHKKALKCLIVLILPIIIILTSYFKVFETFELATFDLRFKIRPSQVVTDKVVIIEIAEDSLNSMGQWPIDRRYYAALTDVLSKAEVDSIVFDILFSQHSKPASDSAFTESAKNSKNVYLPVALRLTEHEKVGPFPKAKSIESEPFKELLNSARGVGHINATTDIDGKRRRVPLFISYQGKVIPQLSFLALSDSLGISIGDMKVESSNSIRVNKDIAIPIDDEGQLIINYAGKWGEAFKHYSFVDILTSFRDIQNGKTPAIDLNELKGKICIVGLTAVGTHDLNPIPLEERYPMVGLHANLINTILIKSFIIRVNPVINILILIMLSLIIAFAALKLKPAFEILIALGVLSGFIIIAFILFGFFNIWVDLFYPSVLIIGVYLFCTFHKYISEQKRRLIMQRDLDIAQKIQKSFLKETPPVTDKLDISVMMVPAKSVGGDLYDFVETDKKDIGLMLGDVSGKGVPAALFMAMTVSHFRFHSKTEDDPVKVVTKLNDQIAAESTSGLFVTLTYMMVDQKVKKLSIVDAGHLPVVHVTKGKKPVLITAKGGMALGIMEGVEFTKEDVEITSGDIFVVYSDGVTEARNIRKEDFEEERLINAVERYRDLSAKEISDNVYKELKRFRGKAPQHDDISIMVLKIK